MKRHVTALLLMMVMCSVAVAETWPPLETYVRWCVLIVKCTTEIKDDKIQYKVDEVWKGKYSPDMFYHRPSDGYLYTGTWHGNEKPVAGREVVFFFTKDNQPSWTKGKILDHSTSFVVEDGKVVYASTSRNDLRQEFTIADFKKAVLAAVEKLSKENAEPPAGGDVKPAPQP